VVGLAVATLVALGLWAEARDIAPPITSYLWVVGIIVATQTAMNIVSGLYGRSWRYASVADMAQIIASLSAGTVVAAVIVNLVATAWMEIVGQSSALTGVPSWTFWLLAWSLGMGTVALPRFAIRYASELRAGTNRASTAPKRSLLYGAGWAGVTVARSAMRDPDAGVKPVGFLDDDRDLAGRRVAGLRVYGDLTSLEAAVRRSRATVLLITMPNASGAAVRRVAEAAMGVGLDVRTVPPVTDLLDSALDASRIRRLRVEDLLRRPTAKEHTPSVREVFTDRTVVITGAAGSIGSELARQVTTMSPRKVVIVDHAESGLFHVERELAHQLRDRRAHDPYCATEVVAHLANVTDHATMARLFHGLRPDIVLHAAAYKHVPMLEDYPSEAVRANVGGTRSVADAAAAAGVTRFVLVSTDKAVRPSSVMGASKRIAEMLVADLGQRLGRPYISVRFGNVLGSNGSVVPIFQEQLEKGRPLTVTHPEMTRYFMTIPEAAWLILDAAAIADGPGLYVLDMGDPVKVLDLAHDVIQLSGKDPASVPIEFVGLRKGEKLHEELFYDQEHVQATSVPKVLRSEASTPPASIGDDVRDFLELADGRQEARLRASLHAYVRWSAAAWEYRDEGQAEAAEEEASSSTTLRDWIGIPVYGSGGAVARPSGLWGEVSFATPPDEGGPAAMGEGYGSPSAP
jgi:FlaA1/EpsC-like NDP-sugar epimerase